MMQKKTQNNTNDTQTLSSVTDFLYIPVPPPLQSQSTDCSH